MPKVLVSDKLSETAVQIFRDNGIDVDFEPALGKDKDALLARIGDYDGLAIRSATKVTEKILEAAKNLKVVGRAGIGVDNVDLAAASRKGVIVMNTPFGNSITTAEHAIAMMFAVARQIPEANASTHAGKWEKSKFMGVELTNKTLGLIGCGNIGSIVADRAIGLHMKVLAYDPFLSDERAAKLGVRKVELDELYAHADFITLHIPKTEKTAGLISAEAIAKMKTGVRIFEREAPFSHTKLFVVDDTWACVGSANWDPRSLRLNFEIGLECYGGAVCARLAEIVAAKKERARRVTAAELEERPLPVRLRDRVAWLAQPYL